MRKYTIIYEDQVGKIWTVGGFDGIEAISMKAAAQMFWAMWTGEEMPRYVTISEVRS